MTQPTSCQGPHLLIMDAQHHQQQQVGGHSDDAPDEEHLAANLHMVTQRSQAVV